MKTAFHQRLRSLKNGSYDVRFGGKHYLLNKQTLLDGDVIKLYAEELGGNDVISLNYYHVSDRWLLKPCEMSDEKVIGFVLGVEIF